VQHGTTHVPIIQDLPRQVVPRWRPFDQTHREEILPVSALVAPRFGAEAVESQLQDWKDNPRSITTAADLVSVAFALGLDTVAIDAAEFVLVHPDAPLPARNLAATYLGRAGFDLQGSDRRPDEIIGLPYPLSENDRGHVVEIHRLRARLIVYPRNPIDWTTLAFHYISLGVIDKAYRAILVAIGLAPENRFVLRAASRFFLHVGEKDRAHQLLSDSGLARNDPWVMAAEIATADAIKKPSLITKRARRALDADRFNDQQLSELASAIGTLEFKSGNDRAGRKLIRRSLLDPSENAIAQAAWIVRQTNSGLTVVQSSSSPEATAWETFKDGKWNQSLEQATKWQEDQPFSSRPAILGSFIESTIFEDHEKGMEIARSALRSNPDDPTLLNNLAYAEVMLGDVEAAVEHISKVEGRQLENAQTIAMHATKGLIAYRSGRADDGRALYLLAIREAQKTQDKQREAQAKAHFAIEEARVNAPEALHACRDALQAARDLHSAIGRAMAAMVERHCAHIATEGHEKKHTMSRDPLPVERPPA
jgi:tetratricopeptide (TPR) repeat protein